MAERCVKMWSAVHCNNGCSTVFAWLCAVPEQGHCRALREDVVGCSLQQRLQHSVCMALCSP
eukprot:1146003-Pelagomonas_calceolata.AAC.1